MEAASQKSQLILSNIRIEAKLKLWDFLDQIKDQLAIDNPERETVIQEVARTALRMLYPHFDFKELPAEMVNMLDTLQVKEKDKLVSSLYDDILAVVINKKNNPDR